MQAYLRAHNEWSKKDPCPECGHNRAAHSQDGCTISYCHCKLDYGIYDPDPLGKPVFIWGKEATKMTQEDAENFLDRILKASKGGKKDDDPKTNQT